MSLSERAPAPDTVPGLAAVTGEGDQYLTFVLGREEYGVPILAVQSIQGYREATPIPNTPAHVLGVINLRGAVLPVLDLRRQFGLPAEFGPTTVIIVVRPEDASERVVGLVADAVSDVCRLRRERIQPPPEFGGQIDVDCLQGLVPMDGKMIVLLELSALIGQQAGAASAAPGPLPAQDSPSIGAMTRHANSGTP